MTDWLDRVNRTTTPPAAPDQPPRTGKGSSTKAWASYATELGYQLPEDPSRSQIIAIVDAGPPKGPNRRALEDQIEAMATGQEHRALIEACRSLADRVDRSRGFDDKAWREYRLALKELREAVGDGGIDSGLGIHDDLRTTFRNPANS